jgi:3-phenylpropionate/trans-cinnamate dioxygenase subunit alpha
MANSPDDLAALVDCDRGYVNPRIFIEEDIYREELEQLFGRAWLFLAHDSMIPNPGDFFATYMGSDPVVVARQRDGSVKAFLNACRHRGMKVCRAEDGNAKTFMCTYHGWTYDLAGNLVNVPNLHDAYHDELDVSRNGLVSVAQIDQYKGLWFATFDGGAPPLIDYLGDIAYYIDTWLDHVPGGIEVLPGVIKWTIRGNWKVAAEQFAGDGYHAPVTHASSLGQFNPERLATMRPGMQFSSRLGHGHSLYLGVQNRLKSDPIQEYSQSKRELMAERLGDQRATLGGNFTVFPNFSGLSGNANFRVWHPKGPNAFEIWSFTVVEKDAPDDVKRSIQLSSTLTEGAAGTVETDDGENWNLMGQLLEQGHQVRKMNWNYQMGLGWERRDHEVWPGSINPTLYGEGPQRAFYRRWVDFMTSPTWPHVEADRPIAEGEGLTG